MSITHTIVQTHKIKRRQEDGSLVTDIRSNLMHGIGKTPLEALDQLLESMAEMELEDDIDDDERESQLRWLIDEIPGRFDVYDGEHSEIPQGLEPVFSEGDI